MTTQRKSSTIANSIRRTLSTCSEETESVCVGFQLADRRHITHAVDKVNDGLADAFTQDLR